MKKYIKILFFILSVYKGYSAELPQLSHNSIVSLVLCSPTSSYEESFGHSAIRLQDDSLKIDVVFNFGMYDSDQSFFFCKVLLGQLESSLEGEAFYQFAERYRKEGRGVREYYLNLTLPERQSLWESLNKIIMSDHRTYQFNITRSNCSTHVRDILFEQLNWNKGYYQSSYPDCTLRDFELKNPIQNPWFHLLFNLILGANSDKKHSIYQSACSPDGLVLLLKTINENERQLVVATHDIFEAKKTKQPPTRFITITFLGVIFCFSLLCSYIQLRNKKSFVVFDRILFFISGVIGLFFLSLMLFSKIPEFRINDNILWALPSNIVLAFLIKKNSNVNRWTFVLARFSCVCILLFLLLSFVGWQYAPFEAYLLAMAILVRLSFYGFKLK